MCHSERMIAALGILHGVFRIDIAVHCLSICRTWCNIIIIIAKLWKKVKAQKGKCARNILTRAAQKRCGEADGPNHVHEPPVGQTHGSVPLSKNTMVQLRPCRFGDDN
jgi:hypothetical protein